MGSFISRIENNFGFGESRIFMAGLQSAGKTSILYRLNSNEAINTLPTIGYNIESIEIGDAKMTVWDVGGQEKIRSLWSSYYNSPEAIIFVIDSCDHDNLTEALKELRRLLEAEYESHEIRMQSKNNVGHSFEPGVRDKREFTKLENLESEYEHEEEERERRKMDPKNRKSREDYESREEDEIEIETETETESSVSEESARSEKRSRPCIIPVLIFANKQDEADALSAEEIKLKIKSHIPVYLLKETNWRVQACSAVTGDGLPEGFLILSQMIKDKRRNEKSLSRLFN